MLHVFSDVSFDPKTKVGVMGTLLLTQDEFENTPLEKLPKILTQTMNDTTCTQLELESVLWAFRQSLKRSEEVHLYTDCQTVCDLPRRRSKLEAKDFKSGRTGLDLSNAEQYRQFFILYDDLNPVITWMKGHPPKEGRTRSQLIFANIDEFTRQQLRQKQ